MPAVRYARLLPYARRQIRGLLAIFACTAAISIVGALQPWPLKILVDYGIRREPRPDWLQSALILTHFGDGPGTLILVASSLSICLFALNSALSAAVDWGWTIV